MDLFESLAIDGKPVTRIRRPVKGNPDPLDGYIDATMMCKAAGKLWGNYWQNNKTKAYLEVLESTIGFPIAKLCILDARGGNGERHTWVHPRVATHLAAWCSPKFDVAVHDFIDRFKNGDLALIPKLLANHDAINGTTSRAIVQTIDNNSIAHLRDERRKAIESTKACGRAIVQQGLGHGFHAIKNDAVNQAAKGFTCSTAQYKRENGVKNHESLRERFAAATQSAVTFMEKALHYRIEKESPRTDGAAISLLQDLKRKVYDLCNESGIHDVPLMSEPVKKQLKLAAPALPPAQTTINNFFAPTNVITNNHA